MKTLANPAPAGKIWFPTTVEVVAEKPGGNANADYGSVGVQNWWAWDLNGNVHGDPGQSSATDPYVYSQMNDPNGQPFSNAEWTFGTVNNPVDPLIILWDNATK